MSIVQSREDWLACETHVSVARWKDGCAGFAQANAGMAGNFAETGQRDLITVSEKGTQFAGGKEYWLRAVASEFKQAASGGLRRAGDGSCREEIARLQVAAVAGVVGDKLRRRPIEIARVGLAEEERCKLVDPHLLGQEIYLQLDVEASLLLIGGGV